MLTYYTTMYTRVEVPVTRYETTRYRVISEVVTRVDVDYYDDTGRWWTRISFPTRYVKSVVTQLLGVHGEREGGREGGRVIPKPAPVPIAPPEERVAVRVAG